MEHISFKRPDMIIALSALLVSLVTAAASIHSAMTNRQYARASLWPNLIVGMSYNDTGFSYLAMNRGTGPAKLEYMQVKLAGKPIKTWQELSQHLPGTVKNIEQSQLVGNTITANQVLAGFVLKSPDNAKAMYELADKVEITTCYCSVYDECWMYSEKNNHAEPIEACPVNAPDAFTN